MRERTEDEIFQALPHDKLHAWPALMSDDDEEDDDDFDYDEFVQREFGRPLRSKSVALHWQIVAVSLVLLLVFATWVTLASL